MWPLDSLCGSAEDLQYSTRRRRGKSGGFARRSRWYALHDVVRLTHSDYIAKPFNARELIARAHMQIQLGKRRRELEVAFEERTAELRTVTECEHKRWGRLKRYRFPRRDFPLRWRRRYRLRQLCLVCLSLSPMWFPASQTLIIQVRDSRVLRRIV